MHTTTCRSQAVERRNTNFHQQISIGDAALAFSYEINAQPLSLYLSHFYQVYDFGGCLIGYASTNAFQPCLCARDTTSLCNLFEHFCRQVEATFGICADRKSTRLNSSH